LHNLGPNTEYDGCSVVDITAAPIIVTQPRSFTAFAGGTVAIAADITGSEPLRFQWFFDGSALPGATNRVLALAGVSNSDSGAYHVTAQNMFGAVTSSVAHLNVESPTYPVIAWQPYSQKIAAGAYISLGVAAAGTPPLRYQWYSGNQPIASATNTALIFDPAQLTNTGTYRVFVTNSLGSVWSLPATLTVTPTNQAGAYIYFNNQASSIGLTYDAPVVDIDGFTRLSGTNYVAQLYAGVTLAELQPVATPRVFRTAFDAGFFQSKTISLPMIAPGSNALVQVRAWERSKGASYEEARALGGKFGKSEILNITTRPPGIQPIWLRGLESFGMQAGLPYLSAGVIRLVEQQAQGVMVWSLEGEANTRYVIEKSVQDFRWEPYLVLTNNTGTVTFTNSASGSAAIFRARILD
jgi:hypothetical protein